MALIINWLITLIIIAVFSAILKWLIHYFQIIRRLPPGPWGLPIFGYVFWLSELSYLDLIKIGKKYGGMFSIGLGTQQYVVLNDWPSVKATIVDQPKIFSGREQTLITKGFSENKDLAFSDGDVWKKQRAIVTQGMNFVGMSKKSVEGHIVTMIEKLIDELTKIQGKELCLEPILTDIYTKFNWNLISNFDFADNPSDRKKFTDDFLIFLQGLKPSNPLVFLPWLRFVPPTGFGYWRYLRSVRRLRTQLRKLIKKYNTTISPDESLLSFHIHKYNDLAERGPPYEDDYLLGTIFELFAGSFSTVLSTSLIALYYLCQHPEIQTRVQNELDTVVGKERVPRISDNDLIHLEALILETHRIGSVAPLSVPHRALETVVINGYTLPKDIVCLQNIYAIHHDPQLWDKPDEFKPERFINHENKIQRPPYFMPFSIGPRHCLGEAFAEMELRLVFASLLQKFTFSFPKNKPKPPLVIRDGVSTIAAPFPVVVTVRE